MRLIEKAWYQNHPVKWLLLPLSGLFWLLSAIRRLLYRLKLLSQPALDVPVVIVGNIGVGGNGKTPMVVLLVEQLQQRGIRVGVISRGYGGQKRNTPLQIDDSVSAAEGGDEPVLIYQRTKAPVVIGADRVAAAQTLIEQGCQLIISDDGLQHYRLKRDVELVIVDGNRRFGNGWLLPAGPLREGQWRLQHVDQVIINGGVAKDNELLMTLRATHVINLISGEKQTVADFINAHGQHGVNALAGIGDPQRFFNTLAQLGFSLARVQGFVDHHHFQAEDIAQFEHNLPLLMTEKDAVKCKPIAHQQCWYLPVDASFSPSQHNQLIELILSRCEPYGF
ncbi:tetraacyldisaccharide 4'-kinase [Thalassotalea maritima]|uniref:tetraacyldisaccharide 4'-kinase n=1 Tax=Thalassotalea maritima TaxID=3242416 RepID=UPI003528CC57